MEIGTATRVLLTGLQTLFSFPPVSYARARACVCVCVCICRWGLSAVRLREVPPFLAPCGHHLGAGLGVPPCETPVPRAPRINPGASSGFTAFRGASRAPRLKSNPASASAPCFPPGPPVSVPQPALRPPRSPVASSPGLCTCRPCVAMLRAPFLPPCVLAVRSDAPCSWGRLSGASRTRFSRLLRQSVSHRCDSSRRVVLGT